MSEFEEFEEQPLNGEENPDESAEDSSEADSIVDILSGQAVPSTPKNKLVQKVLRQLLETYGFDRGDIRVGYRLKSKGKRTKIVDIALLRHGQPEADENVERVIVCAVQKKKEKLRSPSEAASDLQNLKDKMQLFPSCNLGMWTNDQEEFFLKGTATTFEFKFEPIASWPPPGEATEAALQIGGVTQIPADPQNLESALSRCFQYLNKNLGFDHKEAFRQIGVLLVAKLYDETLPLADRHFWVAGNEPFDSAGQLAIQARINKSLAGAKTWHPDVFRPGWDLHLGEPDELARVVSELARYSLSETLPRSRTLAFRRIVGPTMDGSQGRYPTPMNVAEMAVSMLQPHIQDRVLDCSSGTGTFLAMAAAHLFEAQLAAQGTTALEASPSALSEAQQLTAKWARKNLFGCELDPYLAVASRLNVLFTVGETAQVFRIDARTFPEGDLDGLEDARSAIPDGSIDVVLTNPWFSTSATGVVTDATILSKFGLGKIWNRTPDGEYVNSGALNLGGVPPEVLFLERAWSWARPGTGRIAILLPDGLLGNPSDEYVRWWILRHCEVLASVDLPIEPFKVTVKEYKLTPALPSLLVLRRRSDDELKQTKHPDYWVFMAVVDRAGVDPRGKLLFQRAPDGEEIIFDEDVIERVREGGKTKIRHVKRRVRRIADELPIVADKFRDFIASGKEGA